MPFRPNMSKDGLLRANITVQYRLSMTEIVLILADEYGWRDTLPDNLTASDIEKIIRTALYNKGTNCLEAADEATSKSIKWARELTSSIWPNWKESDDAIELFS